MIGLAIFLAGAIAWAQPHMTWVFPKPYLTPGDVLTTDAKKVCAKGYATRVRAVPEMVKRRIFAEYDIRWEDRFDYEVDHLVPLSLGGSNDIKNLWPERYDIPVGAHQKDQVENYLRSEVCGGRLLLAEAQKRIRRDWYGEYRRCCVPDSEKDSPPSQPAGVLP